MGELKGFMKYKRQGFKKESVAKRKKHYKEFVPIPDDEFLATQGARCMDCGIPFCQSGCPIGNIIPDWNDLVYRGKWQDALHRLQRTNNFPEFTGRVCPAPCEDSCTLAINKDAVSIKNIEVSIVEKGYQEGWLFPRVPATRTGKSIAVVGSGPAGLAAADQLNQTGHAVTVFEKNEVLGGLLALGIPDFKLEKEVIERRVERMRAEGVEFKTGVHIGKSLPAKALQSEFDAVILCGGAENARPLPIPGSDLKGVMQAMEFLSENNRRVRGISKQSDNQDLSAKGKKVVVLGGGDTGSDCVGTSNRHGATSIKQFELLPMPPEQRTEDNPWPQWGFVLRTSSSHEEGCERDYSILTKKFSGENGVLKKLHAVRLKWGEKDPVTGRASMEEIPGSEFTEDVDRVMLALGFLGPVKAGMIEELGLELDERSNIKTDVNKMSSVPGVFAAGDMRRGQSLVVWAIQEGRHAATCVDKYLQQAAVKK